MLPVLVIVPVMFTMPLVLLQVPMPPVAFSVPPKFTVAAFRSEERRVGQARGALSSRILQPVACSVALFERVSEVMVRVRPVTCGQLMPLLEGDMGVV